MGAHCLLVVFCKGACLRMLAKLTTMSAMKRPTIPNTPPLAPTNARQVSSNAALKKLPAQSSAYSGAATRCGPAEGHFPVVHRWSKSQSHAKLCIGHEHFCKRVREGEGGLLHLFQPTRG